MSLICLALFVMSLIFKTNSTILGDNFATVWALFSIADALWLRVFKK